MLYTAVIGVCVMLVVLGAVVMLNLLTKKDKQLENARRDRRIDQVNVENRFIEAAERTDEAIVDWVRSKAEEIAEQRERGAKITRSYSVRTSS